MPTATVHTYAPSLVGEQTYTVLLPDRDKAGPGPYPVLLQLHGMQDEHTSWLFKSRIWVYTERLPLIVVMPSGGNFWWSNVTPKGKLPGRPEFSLNYEDYLTVDLRQQVEDSFNTRKGERWAIGGLSMGGYGAIHTGLRHPDLFCSIYAHSSAIPPADYFADVLSMVSAKDRAELDCYSLAKGFTPETLPRLGFDCGVDDFLIDQNRNFDAHLTALDLPHTYKEYPGAHTWEYWDLHVPEALKQHCEVLGIKPNPIAPPPGSEE